MVLVSVVGVAWAEMGVVMVAECSLLGLRRTPSVSPPLSPPSGAPLAPPALPVEGRALAE